MAEIDKIYCVNNWIFISGSKILIKGKILEIGIQISGNTKGYQHIIFEFFTSIIYFVTFYHERQP